MAYINIDTKYAQRDVNRMRTALMRLNDARTDYAALNTLICDTYKGQAANALSDVISSRIKKIDALIGDINLAKARLEDAIQNYEELSKKIQESVNGR